MSLANILLLYAITAIVFFMIDLLWLGVVAKNLYEQYLGALLLEKVNWVAAILFYLIYIGGIQLFVLQPAILGGSGLLKTAVMGGLLGFFAYSTFDLTSLALFKGWSVTVVLIDILWGTFLTGSVAALALWLARIFIR